MFTNYIRKPNTQTHAINHFKMAMCQGASCASGPSGMGSVGPSGNGDDDNTGSGSSGSPFTPPSQWEGPLVRSENSADIAEYHAAQAVRAAIQARRDAANAAHAARAAARAARLAKRAAQSFTSRRPQGGGRKCACTRRRK
jgi:hypothetical protein